MQRRPSPFPSLVTGSWPALAEHLARALASHLKALAAFQTESRPPLVLVPGASVTAGIIDAIGRCLPNGSPLPDFVTPEALAARVIQPGTPAAPALVARWAMEAAAYAQKGVIEEPLLQSPFLPSMALRSWRDVADSGIDPFRITSRSPPEKQRLESLQRVWRSYAAHLEHAGYSDPAVHLAEAVKRLIAEPMNCFAVYGFYDATGLQEAMIRALLAGSTTPLILVPTEIRDGRPAPGFHFAERFILQLGLSPADAHQIESTRGTLTGESFLSPAAERERVCDAIADHIRRGFDRRRIGVVQRQLDPLEADTWHRAANLRGFVFSRPRVLPFAMHRSGRAVIRLLELRQRNFRRADIIELIESGLIPFRPMAGRSAMLDHHVRRLGITGGPPHRLRERRPAEPDPDFELYIHASEIAEQMTQEVRAEKAGRDWAKLLGDWLSGCEPRTSVDLEVTHAAGEFIGELASTGLMPIRRERLLAELRELNVALESSEPGVFLGDFMQARGRRFKTLFMAAAVEGKLPQGRREDPMLPDPLRQKTGLRRIGTGEDEEQMLFEMLLASSDEAVLSWTEADDRGRSQRPSALAVRELTRRYPEDAVEIIENTGRWAAAKWPKRTQSRTGAEAAAAGIIRGEGIPAPVARTLSLIAGVGTGGSHDGYLNPEQTPFGRLQDILGAISPTALETYGECPQKFLLRSVLRIDENEEPEDAFEMELRRKGSIRHAILEQFYRLHLNEGLRLVSETSHPDSLLRTLVEPIAESAFAREDVESPPRIPLLRSIEREQAIEEITRFVAADLAELLESGYRPAHFEYPFGELRDRPAGGPPVLLEVGPMRLSIRGVIDRVDIHPAGGVRIVDYKLGKGTSHQGLQQRTLAGQKLQLGLYCRAWSEIHSVPPARITAQIIPTGNAAGNRDRLTLQYSDVASRLQRVLELFAQGIVAGRFPTFHGNHCSYCPVEQTCRTHNDPEERLSLSAYAHAASMLWPDEDWS